MHTVKKKLLAVNGGSSSIKFAVYEVDATLTPVMEGSITNIGSKHSTFKFINHTTKEAGTNPVETGDFNATTAYFVNWLASQEDYSTLIAIGHRLVHGMEHTVAEKITPVLLDELKKIAVYVLRMARYPLLHRPDVARVCSSRYTARVGFGDIAS